MSNIKKNIGVITEQGYAAGMGLGFNPVNENELNPSKKTNDDRKNVKDKEDKTGSKKN